MPCTPTFGLRFSRTIASVFSSWTSPRSERYSHCTGHDHAGRRDERVDRQQAERRRRVDEHEVVGVAHLDERLLERALASDQRAERELRAGEVDRRDREVDLTMLDHLGDRNLVDEDVEHRPLDHVRVEALAHRQVALRVEVDEQHAVAHLARTRRRGSASSSSSRRRPSGSRTRSRGSRYGPERRPSAPVARRRDGAGRDRRQRRQLGVAGWLAQRDRAPCSSTGSTSLGSSWRAGADGEAPGRGLRRMRPMTTPRSPRSTRLLHALLNPPHPSSPARRAGR